MISCNNLIKYKEFYNHDAVYTSDGGSYSDAVLKVDTELLSTYGAYLENLKTTLDDLLDSLNTQMASITNGWSDNDGIAFKEKFSDFVKESKKISDEINELGKYAKTEASKYDTILAESIVMMGEE